VCTLKEKRPITLKSAALKQKYPFTDRIKTNTEMAKHGNRQFSQTLIFCGDEVRTVVTAVSQNAGYLSIFLQPRK